MASEKTEQPTARRRQKAREEGQISRSADLSSSLAVLAALMVGAWAPLRMAVDWRQFLATTLAKASGAAAGAADINTVALLDQASWLVLRWSLPALAAAWAIATLGSVAQGGFLLAPSRLAPKLERLNPANNLKNMFSPASASRLLRSLIPAGGMAYLCVLVFTREWRHFGLALDRTAAFTTGWTLALAYEIGWKAGLILLVWSGVDYALQKRQLSKQLRMTKEEVRRDHKETEGNPETKRRIRRLQRTMARRRMMQSVPRATVVVVNPTEYAIALQYDPLTTPAPVVLAKGRDHLARQIKEVARRHDIPTVENVPLAHALYRSVEVGQMIPAALYATVAEILAFLYKRQGPRPRPALAAARSS